MRLRALPALAVVGSLLGLIGVDDAVSVAPVPDAAFVIGSEPRRVGQPIEFAALAEGFPRYVWQFGDGTSGRGSTVSHRYRQAGTYFVTLQVFGGDGRASFRGKRLTVHGAPSPDILPTIRGRVARSHKDPELSKAAAAFGKRLTGRWSPRAVLCWNDLDWSTLTGPKREIVAGFVEFRSPRQVHLAPEVCRRVELVRYKRPRPAATRFTAFSILVFTHEVVHTLGIGNEAAATCFALQLSGFMSKALGTNRAFAERIEGLLTGWYKQDNLARGYWSAECRDGGRLDLLPDQAGWPMPLSG